jgi:hypothetical protein
MKRVKPCFLVSIASIFRWRIFEIEKILGFSHNARENVAKAETMSYFTPRTI